MDCWTGGIQFDLTWKGCGSLFWPWNMYWRRILLANCSKSRKSCRLIMVLLVTGVGINLRPLDSTLTWSSDSWWVERFLRNFSFNSLSLAVRLFSEVFLLFLRRLFLEIPSLVLWPAFVESENTLLYCLSCLFAEFISTCEKTMFFKSEICFCKSDKFTLLWFTMWFFDCVSLKGCLVTYLFLWAFGFENALSLFFLAFELTFVEAS